jgi:cob(I)alamin adenosyltransferase
MKTELELHQRAESRQASGTPIAGEQEQGLVVVFTGQGKGKTTAAIGMAWRMIAAGRKVAVLQFVSTMEKSAELKTLGQHPLCTFNLYGNACQWQSTSRQADISMVNGIWQEAKSLMANPAIGMVILDDILPMIREGYLSLDVLMQTLKDRRPDLHVVLSGRNAPFELTDFADLATDMRCMKHPYPAKKIAPQSGIEF